VKLTVTPEPGWHTYPTNASQASKNRIGFAKDSDLILVGPLVDPPGFIEKAEAAGEVSQIYESTVTYEFKAVVSPRAVAGKKAISLSDTKILVCQSSCFNSKPEDIPPLALEILPGPALPIPPEYQAAVD